MTATLPDTIDRAACQQLDRRDPLSALREQFVLDDSIVYLDGNSLGRLPIATAPRVAHLIDEEWARGLVRSWTEADWMNSPLRLGAKIAGLIGAQPDEVIVTDSTTVDLFKLTAAVLRARPKRRTILTEHDNFPTDRYVSAGAAALIGDRTYREVAREEITDSLDSDVALLTLTHVDYRTGAVHDMRALTEAAHRHGALALWDLSHSTGAVAVDLSESEADLAVGCGYKYLNGGPGAPAFLFVAKRLQDELHNPIQGWLGHETPFTLDHAFRRASGMRAWMSGSPPVIAIAALEVAVDLLLEVGMQRVAEKARSLTGLFIQLADARLARHGFEVVTPRNGLRRGSQVSLRHADAYRIDRALIDRGVIPDFREPDILRCGLAPLYTRFVDVWDAVEQIAAVMDQRAFDNPAYGERSFIT